MLMFQYSLLNNDNYGENLPETRDFIGYHGVFFVPELNLKDRIHHTKIKDSKRLGFTFFTRVDFNDSNGFIPNYCP